LKNFDLLSFKNADELARAAACAWLDEVEAANRSGKVHCVALSGGRITQKFFASLVEQGKGRATSFERVHFFWADERCVPPTDAESNFKMAQELLFGFLKLSERQIHRVRGEEAPELAAELAEKDIRRVASPDSEGRPILDMVFLGLGEDGHVASLFPSESETWMADKAIYRVIRNSPKPPPNRVTLGYGAIASARQVWMLASGSGKESALRESLSPGTTPFGRVLRLRPSTKIFTDISLPQ
jgi:6-phosphogluconolactonase